jgi:Flp pilus assembly protein TadD
MLEAAGSNPVVLNNLAWLYHEAEDGRALATAQRAHELAPEQPEIMDTYGWILFAEGQREQGLKILTRAAELSAGNPDIGYHLASALAQSGQTALARDKLHKILEQHREFGLRKEAELLLARLGTQ